MVVTSRTSDTVTSSDDAMKLWVTEQLNNVITSFTERLDTNQFQQSRSGTGESSSRFSRMGKLEFPKFHGDDVQGWLFRVKQFFDVDNVHAADKIKMVSIHLYDKALAWHLQYVKHHENVGWNEYEEAILKRFGPLNEDPMAELKQLRYESSMSDYQSKFEKLITQVDITESQSVSMFLAGLPASIELNVRMFRPKSLADAFSLANLQEAVRKQRSNPLLPTPRHTNAWNANRAVVMPGKPATTTLALPAPTTQYVTKQPANQSSVPRKFLSQKELAEKRAKNQCFYCDKKYVSGHKCEGQLFTLEVRSEEEEVFEECLDEEDTDVGGFILPEDVQQFTPHISLNSLNGIPTHNTMRIKGHVLNQLLHILMDSGSTHNFLDLYTAKKLGCKIRSTCPLNVFVAGGSKLISQYMVKNFQWKVQGVLFTSDVMLLPLGGCELVLGIQWLSTLGTIKWNFKELRMEFVFQGKKVVLRGTNQSELSWMSGKVMSKYVNHQGLYLNSVCCFGISATLNLMQCATGQELSDSVELQAVLEEYSDVFEEPKTLPPHRSFDHQIPLKNNEASVNIRPYRYPPAQKDVIESMIKELLDSGVIRPSHSPFSSPIVMVKKKDGS